MLLLILFITNLHPCLVLYESTQPLCLSIPYACKIKNCTLCSDGFFEKSTNCQKCLLQGCKTCQQSQTCSTCFDGYYNFEYLNDQFKKLTKCIKCQIGAKTCNSQRSTECYSDYSLINDKCLSCESNGRCKRCKNEQISCQECIEGYFILNNICQICSSNCIECLTYTQCTLCKPGHKLPQCNQQCSAGQVSSNQSPYPCSNCPNKCLICNNGRCQMCQVGYYVLNNVCLPGGSILCKRSTGIGYTKCMKNYECQKWSQKSVQDFQSICLPKQNWNDYSVQFYTRSNSFSTSFCRTLVTPLNNVYTLDLNQTFPYRKPSYQYTIKMQIFFNGSSSQNNATFQPINSNSQSVLQSQKKSYNLSYVNSCSMINQEIKLSLFDWQGEKLNIRIQKQTFGLGQMVLLYKTCLVQFCHRCSSSANCLACEEGKFLDLNKCLQECSPGLFTNKIDNKCYPRCPQEYYEDITNQTCQKCISPCLTCSSKNQCLSCTKNEQKNYFFDVRTDKCQQECQLNDKSYYGNKDTFTCQICISPCLTCSQFNGSQCLSCVIGYLLNNTCRITCPDQYYDKISVNAATCQKCESPCENCIINNKFCTLCKNKAESVHEFECKDKCPQEYFSQLGVCEKCIPPCRLCEGSGLNCSKCLVGNLYIRSSKNNICVNECPYDQENKIAYYSDQNQTCQKCTSSCSKCTSCSTSTNCICLACHSNYYLINQSCSNNCSQTPQNIYRQNQTNKCETCPMPCDTCNQLDKTKCLSCLFGFLFENQCKNECPMGTYSDQKICKKCFKNCLKCSNQSECEMCDGSVSFLKDSNCLSECSENEVKYRDSISGSGQCIRCDQKCLKCIDVPTKCTQCKTQQFLFQYNCLSQCPSQIVNNQCVKCPQNCSKCINDGNCTQCNIGFFLQQQECRDTCKQGFYKYNGKCEKCRQKCKRCQKGGCIECKQPVNGSNYFLFKWQCLQACSYGYYPNISSKSCQPCSNSNCLICTSTLCTQCKIGYFLNENECLKTCPQNKYQDASSKKCIQCIDPCQQCNKTIGQYCLSCDSGYSLHDNQCFAQCPQGYYKIKQQQKNKCNLCQPQCKECSSKQNCSKCSLGYFFDNYTCVKTCPSDLKYQDQINRICNKCLQPCEKCQTASTCISCTYGSFFKGSCFDICPKGYYQSQKSCNQCSQNCKECSKSKQNCTSCNKNKFLHQNKCLNQCPKIGFFESAQFEELTCEKCFQECKECSQQYTCTSCVNTSKLIQQGRCVDQCGKGYFTDKLNSTCIPCSIGCQQCPTSHQICQKCASTYLFNHTCLSQCPQQFYPTVSQFNCLQCQPPCQQCTDRYFCKTCIQGYVLYQQTTCVPKPCPYQTWYREDTQKCEKECPGEFYRYYKEKVCYRECPVKLFGFVNLRNEEQKICIQRCGQGMFVNKDYICQSCENKEQICQKQLIYFSVSILYAKYDLSFIIWFQNQIENSNFNEQTLQITSTPLEITSTNLPRILQQTSYQYTIQPNPYNQRIATLIKIKINRPLQSQYIHIQLNNNYRKQFKPNPFPIQNYKYSQKVLRWNLFQDRYQSLNGLGIFFVVLFFLYGVYAKVLDRFILIKWGIQFGQILWIILYLQTQYPPNVQSFFSAFSSLHLLFLGQFKVPQDILLKAPPKFMVYHYDNLFIRNIGYAYIVFIVFTVLTIIAYVSWYILQRLQKFQRVREYLKRYFQGMIFQGIIEINWILYLSFGIFIFVNFRDYNTSTPYLIFNIFFQTIHLIYFIIYPIFIFFYINKSINSNNHLFYNMVSDVNLSNQVNTIAQYQQLLFYFRKIIMVITIGLLSNKPVYFLTINLLVSLIIMMPIVRFRPYQNNVIDWGRIFLDGGFVMMLIFLLFYEIGWINMTEQQCLGIGWVIFVIALIMLVFFFIWSIQFFKEMKALQIVPQVAKTDSQFVKQELEGKESPMKELEVNQNDNIIQQEQQGYIPEEEKQPDIDVKIKPFKSSPSKKQNDFINYSSSQSEVENDIVPPLVLIKCMKDVQGLKQEEGNEEQKQKNE